MRSFCSLRVKTETAEGTRSGKFQRPLLIGHQDFARLQLILAVSRYGYSWLSSSIFRVVTSFIGRLFASACSPSSAFVGVGGKLSLSSSLQSSGFVQLRAVGFFCRIEGVRMQFAPDRKNSRPRAPEAPYSALGGVFAFVAVKAWPNQPVNLTRNGVRQSAGKVHCVHSSSPAAYRTPLRSGYRQR
jgi:hypothetical protein